MNRPLMGDSAYAIYHALKNCMWLQTGSIQQIIDIMRSHKLGLASFPRVSVALKSLVKRGFVETYTGTNPHSGKENDTLYRTVPE